MPMTADALPPQVARSAPDRLLAVLAAFDHAHPALCLTDISRRAGLTLTTTHRLVGALTEWGALERDADGVYHVGLRLWEVAALAPRGLALRQVALPYLEDLYEATHENVQLAVRDGAEVVYIEWLSGRSAVGVHIRVGARWPLHATGVAWPCWPTATRSSRTSTARGRWPRSPRTPSRTRCGCAANWPKYAVRQRP